MGISAGFRGLRIGTGPRGAYMRAGLKGVSYYRRIGGGQPASPPAVVLGTANATTTTVLGQAPGVGDDLAARYLEARRRHRYAPWFAGFGFAAVLAALANWPSWLAALLFVAVLAGTMYLAGEDASRRRIAIEYFLDPRQTAAFTRLNGAFHAAANCAAVWCIGSTITVYWKQHAGANALVSRVSARPVMRPPAGFVSNVAAWTVQISGVTLSFLPDRLFIVHPGAVSDVRYPDIRLSESYTDFRESEVPPADALRVGTTWLHPNKNGGPDRRFAYNPEVPVFRYSELRMDAGATSLTLQFSRPDVAAVLAAAIRAMP